MELMILEGLQKIHNQILDPVMVLVTHMGDKGLLWIGLGALLCLFPRYRKCGITMLVSLLLAVLIGNVFLKNIVARPRPCWQIDSIKLLINMPKDYSFPSGHTFASFAAATSLFLYNAKKGIIALVVAALIGFSRLYLFVHYPTDVLAGCVFGIGVAIMAKFIVDRQRLIVFKQ